MARTHITKKIWKGLFWVVTNMIILMVLCTTVFAATAYEVTKSGGAHIRTNYYESASSVRKVPQGTILWVSEAKLNKHLNKWYKLTDGYWIYSENVKQHSCIWSQTSRTNPTCTASGSASYKCYACGKTKTTTLSAYGHQYSGNVCTRCGAWNTGSILSRSSVNAKYIVLEHSAKVHSGPYGACKTVTTLSKGTEIIVTEKLLNASLNTWFKYSGGYIFSDYVKPHNSCTWSAGSITKQPTCTSEGAKTLTCTLCGKAKTTAIAKLSHKFEDHVCKTCGTWNTSSLLSRASVDNVKYFVIAQSAKVHTGPYGGCSTTTTLSRGAEIVVTEKVLNAKLNTWYKYSGGYIFSDYVVAHKSCTWSSAKVTKQPTCTSAGKKVQTCTVCGITKTTTIAKLGHNFQDCVCKTCGEWNTSSLLSKSSVGNVKYIVTAKSAKVRSGPYSGCSTTTTLSRGAEIVVTEKVVNAKLNTWFKYSGGYIFSDYVAAHKSCSWSKATVTKQPTCTSAGKKVQNCTVCGITKTSSIAKLGHKFEDCVCKTCGEWNTSSLLSKSSVDNVKYFVIAKSAKVRSGPYSGCSATTTLSRGAEIVVTEKVVNAKLNTWFKYSGGYIFSDYVVAHKSCSWSKAKVTKQPTCTSAGKKVQNCTVCGKTKTSNIAKLGHKFEDYVCKTCGKWNKSSLVSNNSVNSKKYIITTKSVKMRSGPYADCSTLATLSKGTEIVVTQKVINAKLNTWLKCSEGWIYSGHVAAHDSCSWSKAKVTKKATCTSAGKKVQTCKVCGKTKTTTIAKLGHKYEDNVCKTCGKWKTSSLKSKKAVNNVKYIVLSTKASVCSGPYSKCEKVTTLSKGTVITVTQIVVNAHGNVWYKYSGGYIYCTHIKNYALHTAKTTLALEADTLYVGQAKKLKVSIKGPSSNATWRSSNTSVATVDTQGKVTAKKAGTCTITVVANEKTDTCKITVKQLAAPAKVKVSKQTAGRTFKVSHKAVSGADGYEIVFCSTAVRSGAVKRETKTYTSTSATVTVSELNKSAYTDPVNACTYRCYVRAYKLIDGQKYYGKLSPASTVHVHNAVKNLTYKAIDYTHHVVTDTFKCAGCAKKVTQTVAAKAKHSFVCGVCQHCGKKQSADLIVAKFYPVVGDGPQYSASEANKKGITPTYVGVKFNDAQFKTDNTSTYNKYLGKLSAVGAAVSYKASYAEKFLKDCGFDSKTIEAANSSSKASTSKAGENDHARYIMGNKKIKGTNTTLLAVLVNGYTTGKYEWVSNFNVGTSGLHAGFSKAAKEITAKINGYIQKHNIDTSNLKIWITGHSRGGAVAGMTAVNLNKAYGAENVFAYCFATPNGVPNATAKKTYSKNIFNIVNPGDFVPYVVPSGWGFTKYGTTKLITVSTNGKKIYKSLSGDTYDGLTQSGRATLIKEFCDYAPSRKAYNTFNGVSKPSNFGRALGLLLSKPKEHWGESLGLLVQCGISDLDTYSALWQMFYNGKATTNIHEAHCMETYIAMLYQ